MIVNAAQIKIKFNTFWYIYILIYFFFNTQARINNKIMNNNFLCIILYNKTKFKKIKNWNFKLIIIYLQILINVKKKLYWNKY